ncbi:peroxiredoxin family protein [Larkinella sp. GY13]|uniref:peroxiredoxin family protein n=1 Tax=Larkinella sp. GY13 TaxID=3453720 RepID=UPI003EECACED
MKSLIFSGILMPFFLVMTAQTSGLAQSETVSAEDVLRKTSQALSGRKTLRYHYHRELNYVSEGIHNEMSGACFLDFSSENPVLDFRYQFSNADMLAVFNGTEQFVCDRKSKTLRVVGQPARRNFESLSFFYDSPVTYRNALPMLFSDVSVPKTVLDTVVDAKPFYAVTFTLKQKVIDYLGAYRPITADRLIRYRLLIDKATHLPIEVMQSNNRNQDFTKTRFQYLDATALPTDSSWYYSSYRNEYKLGSPEDEKLQIIPRGQTAPDWTLPVFDRTTELTLSQLKGKIVLLEFWIRNCGYCVAAVPELNAIYNQYKTNGFELLGINPHDSKEVIAVFEQKIQPEYPLLYGAQEVAKRYGIGLFPVVVLLDKTGNVLYSGEFRRENVAKLIEENL